MSDQELIQALRCTSAPGGPIGDCEKCQFWKTENLTPEQSEQLGTDEWASCDIDHIGLEAADRLANQNTHILALQKEIAGLRAKLPPVDTGGGAAAGTAGGGSMTNGDSIRAMTDRELAEIIVKP